MLTFNRILLASDFSPNAEAALHYAAALARQSHAPLLVLHVIDTRVTALSRWHDIFRSTEVFAAKETHENDAFERLLSHPALDGLTVDRVTQYGNPPERIIDLGLQTDLVVIGTPGNGKTPGKVARQVAHGCATPVLLVPEGGSKSGQPQAGADQVSLQRVLLALHFAHYAPQAIDLSQTLATDSNAILEVLQVIDPDQATTYPLDAGGGLYHNRDAMKILLQKRLADLVPDDPGGLTIERSVLQGSAAEVIVHQSHIHQADLIVMSAHAYGTWQKFFTVSTVDDVLEHAPCPVLAVPYPHRTVPATTFGNGSGDVG